MANQYGVMSPPAGGPRTANIGANFYDARNQPFAAVDEADVAKMQAKGWRLDSWQPGNSIGISLDAAAIAAAGGALKASMPPTGLPRLVAIGDSITSTDFSVQNPASSPQNTFVSANGERAIVQAICPRFRFDQWVDTAKNTSTNLFGGNLGQGGLKSSDFDPIGYNTSTTPKIAGITRLNWALAMRPDCLFIGLGANDLSGGAANSNTTIRRIVAYARARFPNMAIIVAGVRATASSKEGSGFPKATIVALNNLLRTIDDPTNRIWFWDSYAAYDQGDGYGNAAWYQDGLHSNFLGAQRAALGGATYSGDNKSLLWIMRQIFPSTNVIQRIPGSPLIADRQTFQGTGGAAYNGVTTSSGVASNMYADGATTYGAAVATLEANAETGGYSQVLTITPNGTTAANTYFSLNMTAAISTTQPANQWARMWAEYEYDNWAYWTAPYTTFTTTEGGNNKTLYAGPYVATGELMNNAYIAAGDVPNRLWTLSNPVLLGAVTQFNTQIRLQWVPAGQTSVGVVKVRQWGIEIIDDPRPAYLFG